MHERHKLMSISEFIEELGYKKSSFYRELQRRELPRPGKYLTPERQNFYRMSLGFPPKWPEILPPPDVFLAEK